MKRIIYLIIFSLFSLTLISGIIDLANLFDYSNQTIPNYIQKDNTTLGNEINNTTATLGRVLFYDKNLSDNNTIACASCHQQEFAFGDPAIQSVGLDGGLTGRHSMRLVNARFANEVRFFWDERAATLEAQTTQPIQDHVEMGFSGTNGDPDFNDLITKLSAIEYYEELFTAAYGDATITEQRIGEALAQFVRSIQSFDSKYDAGIALAGNPGAPFPNFTNQENMGKQLFMTPPQNGGANCNVCHGAPEFDIVPNSMNNGVVGVAGNPTLTDFTNTRAPSLRDVARTDGTENGPFMHDGSLATLDDVMDHYNLITNVPGLDNRLGGGPGGPGQNLQLTQVEKDAVVAFLHTLSGTDVYTNERWSDPFDENGALTILNGMYDIYVDETATGNNDGSDWENAYTDLQDALAMGDNFDVHIAQGTYKPTTNTARGIAFEMPQGIELLGGYPSGGGERNPALYPTILSGDIDNDGTSSGNSFHVVLIRNVNQVKLDGIVISDGNADNAASFARSRGGGIYSSGSEFVISDVTLSNNKALYGGAMFATLSPNVTITDCSIEMNEANYGSALYHSNETQMFINRTRIINNNSLIRCAIEINNSLYTKIENSIIANNDSANANAIGSIATNRNQTCDIFNTTILGEVANKNLITLQIGYNDVLTFNINNSIIAHQNINHNKNVVAFNNGTLHFNHNHCYFQGSSVIGTGTNTLYSATAGDLLLDSDYALNECSPAVDAGDDALASGETDIDGNPRIFGVVDLGAYEAQATCSSARMTQGQISSETEDGPIAIRVAPNPVIGKVHIMTTKDNLHYTLMDASGQIIARTNEQYFDMAGLSSGIYLIQVHDATGIIETIKVLKH